MNYLKTDLNDAFRRTYSGKRVFVTGHTGFKGSWLAEWLLGCGAQVRGYALAPVTKPAIFNQLGLENRMEHVVADIRDQEKLSRSITEFSPDFLFHLAAQPLVRASYKQPRETFETNINGTINLLEVLRSINRPCVSIFVSSDKCYRNNSSGEAFKETDPLGGDDPYSASKGAMEIVVHSYRKSFFSGSPVKIATARAGNVIGGGDYAADRILPDCIRALAENRAIPVRNPSHTRPWQHVLEPLSGYLWLAARIEAGWLDTEDLYAFNFGPTSEGNRTVKKLVETVLAHWPGAWEQYEGGPQPGESRLLALLVRRAQAHLDWSPRWSFEEAVAWTVGWYRQTIGINREQSADVIDLTREHIRQFALPHD